MRILPVLLLLWSRSLADEAQPVNVVHNYYDPGAEVWEVHVRGDSVVTSEEPEPIDTFDFERLEKHARAGGMPFAFFFHPSTEPKNFSKSLFRFLKKSNDLSLKYSTTIVLPGERGFTFKTSTIRLESANKISIKKNPDQWSLNSKKIPAGKVIESTKNASGEFALAIEFDVFESLESMSLLNKLVTNFNACNKYGDPKYLYKVDIIPANGASTPES